MPLRNRKLEMGNKPIQGVADAVEDGDAVNKGQMDDAIASIDLSTLVPETTQINTTSGELTGGGALSGDLTLGLDDTVVTPGDYTFAAISVDQKGRVTAASNGTLPESWVVSFATANQSVTSTTAFVDVTGLTFPVTSGTYAFEALLPNTSGAGGVKIAVNGPTLTALYVALGNNSTATTAYDTAVLTAGGSDLVIRVHGVVTVSASGTFAFRFAQSVSNAAASTILAGAWVNWRRVA